jgi:hypothetical protein
MTALLATAAAAAPGAAEDIRGIRGPIAIDAPELWILYVGLGVLVVAAAYGLLLLWRSRRARSQTPYERATAQLKAAESEIDPARPDVFAERVSNAVREYLEARFSLPATHRTSEEFLSELLVRDDVVPQLAAQHGALSTFLDSCDFAKFAGRALHGEAVLALRAAAHRLIDAAESTPSQAAP